MPFLSGSNSMKEEDIEIFLKRPTTSRLDDIAKNDIRKSYSRISDPEIDFDNHREYVEKLVNGELNSEYQEALKGILKRFREREGLRRAAKLKDEKKSRIKFNLILFFVVLPVFLVLIEVLKRW